MKIEINRQSKIVELWLTNAEQQDSSFMEGLAAYYEPYQAEQYRVAIFLSGSKELSEVTEELLLHNRTVAAKSEQEQEYSQTMGMMMGM